MGGGSGPGPYHFPDRVIEHVKGRAMPKPENQQDTDAIAPARFLRWISFRPMGLIAFYDERHKDGWPVIDHPFNDPQYAGANILIAGANFGCGSSREHAPQALKRSGVDAVIAESFADIFYGNAESVGIVPVTMGKDHINHLIGRVQEKPYTQIKIDLLSKETSYAGDEGAKGFNIFGSFEIPEGTRQAFLHGYWDAMPVLRSNEERTKAVEEKLPYMSFR